MAVYSMTGFAAVQDNAPPAGHSCAWGLEVRSVNSRFLDITFKIPDTLRVHEAALRQLVTSGIKRGKLEIRIFSTHASHQAIAVPSAPRLSQLATAQEQVKAWLPHARELSVADILRLGGGADTGDSSSAPAWGPLQALATQALKKLQNAREKEGQRLVLLLQNNLGQLRTLAAQAAPLIPQAVEQQRERFLLRWNEALGTAKAAQITEAMQERALAEATAFAIRIDVAEELGRLNAHLDEVENLLTKGGELGKRLDFMVQELHREANTLGSKSTSLELTRISMDMKVLIEQMREQVQNIE